MLLARENSVRFDQTLVGPQAFLGKGRLPFLYYFQQIAEEKFGAEVEHWSIEFFLHRDGHEDRLTPPRARSYPSLPEYPQMRGYGRLYYSN